MNITDICKNCEYLTICEAMHETTETVVFTSSCFKFNNFTAIEIFKEQIQLVNLATLKNIDDVIEFGKTLDIEIVNEKDGETVIRTLTATTKESTKILGEVIQPVSNVVIELTRKLEKFFNELTEEEKITFSSLVMHNEDGKLLFDFDCFVPFPKTLKCDGGIKIVAEKGCSSHFKSLKFDLDFRNIGE